MGMPASASGPKRSSRPRNFLRAPSSWPVVIHVKPQQTSPELTRTRYPAARKTRDRKSTRLNSSHVAISYAVFCLKKKNNDKYKITSINNQILYVHQAN